MWQWLMVRLGLLYRWRLVRKDESMVITTSTSGRDAPAVFTQLDDMVWDYVTNQGWAVVEAPAGSQVLERPEKPGN